MMRTTQICLASRPHGAPRDSDFDLVTTELPGLAENQLLLRTIFLSLDPYMRGRMSDAQSYADPVAIGDVIVGGTICEVLESRSAAVGPGDVVLAATGWQTHAVVDAQMVRRLDPTVAPLSLHLGVLGMPGFTAYAGLLEIGRPQPRETVVVAAATGPVGSAVGQIARIKGARAVGIAGGPEKALALVEHFGFDAAIDHRSPYFRERLAEAVPDGVDVYFENVGGHVSAAVTDHLNSFARIPLCGLIADYNSTSIPEGPDRLPAYLRKVLTQSLTVRGFINYEFTATHHESFLREMSDWVRRNQLRYREDVVDGLEQAPHAFREMLAGRNFGKVVVRVGDETTPRKR